MKIDLLKILKCPTCLGPLQVEAPVEEGNDGEIRTGNLRCRCGAYPIDNYVPRFAGDRYATNFGMQWNLFRRTQLDRLAQDNSEARFASEIGFRLEEVVGRTVLDAGCGMGRFADVVSRWGGTVVGIDLSTAVEAAYDNIGRRPNVHLLQADISQLPFPDGTFDYIYSIGVLHHTPDPPHFFSRLVPLLKPGGIIGVCVYSREIGRLALAKRHGYRTMFRSLPQSTLLSLSRWFGAVGYRLAHTAILRHIVGLLPAVVYPDKPQEWSELDTFDWLSPAYEFRYTREEVTGWFRQAGLHHVRVTDNTPGWACVTGSSAPMSLKTAAS
jgi:SAM-dependent methyltransferase